MFYRFFFCFSLHYTGNQIIVGNDNIAERISVSMVNQYLSLSLFLMLLSFFIVLNSISEVDQQKSLPVLNSLSLVFSNEPLLEDDTQASKVSDFLDDKRQGDTLESMEGLFNTHIAGFEPKRNRLGTVMHVKLPIGRFENAVRIGSFMDIDAPVGTTGSFLQTMISLIRSSENGQPYRMDMILNLDDDPNTMFLNEPVIYRENLTRISKLAFDLEQAGMPRKMLASGMVKGRSGYVDLYFYKYEPFTLPKDVANALGEDADVDAEKEL